VKEQCFLDVGYGIWGLKTETLLKHLMEYINVLNCVP